MNLSESFVEDERTRERRCIVTGEILSDAHLVRFVASPDGQIVPDIAANLPGRGMWVKVDRSALNRAIAKNAFSRAAKENLSTPKDLAERTERQLVQRMLSDLGLARRAGQLVLGYDSVARLLDAKSPPAILVEAGDGAPDGRRKLISAAHARGLEPAILDCLSSHELSLALGRENVVHAALKSGRLAERLKMDAGRLSGLRRADQELPARVKSDRHERDE